MKNKKKIIRRWKKLLEEIIKDITDLVEIRYVFNEIVSMRKNNEELKKGNIFWEIFRINYVSSVVLNICRQIDTDSNSLSLINLLNKILRNPKVITKKWFASQYQKNKKGNFKRMMFDKGKADFENNFGKRNFIRKSMLSSDISKIKHCTRIIKKFRNKKIAHKDKNLKLKFNINFNDLDKAINILEQITLKYNLLLDQSAYTDNTLLPTIQYDWKKIFKSPWIKK
ncbi:MAG: hypothetical protein ACKKMV_00375 [Candidatus Nealsonbacteria bacterium]